MAGTGKEDYRIIVKGLALTTKQRHLENAFSPYGKILKSLVMYDEKRGRSRGFGFITFEDLQGMQDSIREMDGKELNGKSIRVEKAWSNCVGDDSSYGGGGNSYSGGDLRAPVRSITCYRCDRPGHGFRECPSTGRYRSSSHWRGVDYGSKSNRFDAKETRWAERHDRHDQAVGDQFGSEHNVDREVLNGDKDKEYMPRGRGASVSVGVGDGDRLGSGGPVSGRSSYMERPGPYNRSGRGRR